MYEQFMGDYTQRFGISASSVIKLREFLSNQPSLHLLYFSTYSGIENSLPYPKHMLRAHYISMSLATVIWECSLNQFFYFTVHKFVCKPRATTNIYGQKYRIQGQLSKSQGKFSGHFASHILGLSVKAIFNIRRLGGFY